jgi:Stage II sporulation protein E (SpoIIE)
MLAFLFLLPLLSIPARAETFTAPPLGPPSVPIAGTWQFHTGDDLAWANAGFDDSGWQSLQADQPWGAQGHAGYRGYAWYRKRINLGNTSSPLGLYVPAADGAYEVYWNSQKIGSSGSLPPHAVWWTFGKDAVFPLGRSATAGVLALRIWAPLANTNTDSAAGGLKQAPRLGHLPTLEQQLQFAAYRREHGNLPQIVPSTLIGAAGLLSLLLFLRGQREWRYLWLSVLLLAQASAWFEFVVQRTLSAVSDQLFVQAYSLCSTVAVWLLLVSIFGLDQSRRWRASTAAVVAVFLAAQLADCILILFWRHAGPGMRQLDAVTTQVYTALGFYVLLLVGFGLARQKTWSLAPLGIAAALSGLYLPLLSAVGLVNSAAASKMNSWSVQIDGYKFYMATMLDWMFLLVLVLNLALHQIRERRRQAEIEMEIKSAQEVQHVLIPEEIPPIPGLSVASVYKPAAEVGGDFFQVIPLGEQGQETGALIVVGDVSGKGLKAAMTVSLIVGTVRTLAEYTRDPAEILLGLNRRLLGRTHGGFATCLVLRISANGKAKLANAGHLAPYRNGLELSVSGSLPLGLSADATYDEVDFRLHESETLMFITDGVLEARNPQGELYGFARVAALMTSRPTVQHVVDEACSFGQEDDITVVSIIRTAVSEPQILISLAHILRQARFHDSFDLDSEPLRIIDSYKSDPRWGQPCSQRARWTYGRVMSQARWSTLRG